MPLTEGKYFYNAAAGCESDTARLAFRLYDNSPFI